MATIPESIGHLVADGDGSHRGAGLEWSSVEYVCHIADNLRIWAERLVAAARRSPLHVQPYDADLLARARRYEAVPVAGALWSLAAAIDDWRSAVELALAADAALLHPERGRLSVADVVRSNGHDAVHHQWDIARIEHDHG
jgi:hypothetical protein